jgi:hypothetical protein
MKRACALKYRDIIHETVAENSRKSNFVRIFPAKNCKMYDKYFSGQRPLNKILYKVLFTSEILPFRKHLKTGDHEAESSMAGTPMGHRSMEPGSTTDASTAGQTSDHTKESTSRPERIPSATGTK